jgi:hypothetical protein
MLRQEKFAGGMSDQKDLDAEFAKAIMGDTKFQVQNLAACSTVFGSTKHGNRTI